MNPQPSLAAEITAAVLRLPPPLRVALGLWLAVGAMFLLLESRFEGVPTVIAAALYLPVVLAAIGLTLLKLYRIGRWLFSRR